MAIRVTLPEKDEDTDEPSPAESLQMAVSPVLVFWKCRFSGSHVNVVCNALIAIDWGRLPC